MDAIEQICERLLKAGLSRSRAVRPYQPELPGRILGAMIPTQTATQSLIDLDRGECLALLASVPVGRLVHAHEVFPCIRPVNFVLKPDGVYLCTADGGEVLQLAEDRAQVVFEADSYDRDAHFGWSVVVLGQLERVRDRFTLDRLADGALSTWTDAGRRQVVRVGLGQLSGRRAGGPAPQAGSGGVQGV